MEVRVPKDTEQLIEVVKISGRDRILQGAVEEIIDDPDPRPFEKSVKQTEIVEMVQIISLERMKQRSVGQLVDRAAPHIMTDLGKVVGLIPQERHIERPGEHIVDVLEQQVVKEIFEGIDEDKSTW